MHNDIARAIWHITGGKVTTEEILKAATPWTVEFDAGMYYILDSEGNVILEGPYLPAAEAAKTAVNSYEKQREALLRVIDSPGERDKWLTEVYAAAGVERPNTAAEYENRKPVSAYEKQRECIRELIRSTEVMLSSRTSNGDIVVAYQINVEAALARAKALL